MKCSIGNRGREEAEILSFLLVRIHYHFQSHFAFARGGWLELGSTSPSCVSSGGLSVTCALSPPSTQETLHVTGKSPTWLCQQTSAKISIQRCRGGSELLKQLANLWHLQHRQAGTLLEDRSQPGAILWKHVCSCQLPCLEEAARWGEEHCTCPASLFPGILSPKMTGNLAGSCIA